MIAVTYGLARFAYGLFLPEMRESLDLSETVLGFIGAGSYAGYCLAIVIALVFTSRTGPRFMAVAAGAVAVVGMAVVDGKTVQDSNTREMIFTVAQLVAFVSQPVALEPGDMILTGTPHGVGVFRDPQVFLKPGDRVEVEVGDFGALSNPVGDYL